MALALAFVLLAAVLLVSERWPKLGPIRSWEDFVAAARFMLRGLRNPTQRRALRVLARAKGPIWWGLICFECPWWTTEERWRATFERLADLGLADRSRVCGLDAYAPSEAARWLFQLGADMRDADEAPVH